MAFFGRRTPPDKKPTQEAVPEASQAGASEEKKKEKNSILTGSVHSNSELTPLLKEYREKIFDQLVLQIDVKKAARMSAENLREEVEGFIARYTEEQKAPLNLSEQKKIAVDIVNEFVGLGPLEVLFADKRVTDILVNDTENVYVEIGGKLQKVKVQFRNERHLFQICQRIANQAGRRVDEASPLLDTRLRDGSRVNITLPPVALNGVSISIRRFSDKLISLEKMVEQGNISEKMYKFFQIAAKSRLNIIVSGGTGSGKTTLLNALAQHINADERIVTIEDSAELRLHQPHVVRLESRPPNIEGEGEITIRELVKNSLRMRPDRIVIGECRSGEAFDMLQAMNTGHDGSLSTVHANTAYEALHRLENMVLMAGFEFPVSVIKGYIAGAVDLIIQVSRMRDGKRRVVEVMEVLDLNKEDQIDTQKLFEFEAQGMDKDGNIKGEFKNFSVKPKFLSKIEYLGLGEELRKCLA